MRLDPTAPQVLSALILAMRHRSVEKLHLILTSGDGRYLTDGEVASGSLARIEGRFRELVAPALAYGASGIVLVHNHPSGDPTPSSSDVAATRDVAAIARRLDIDLLDHIVVGWQSACSLRKAGLL